MRDYSDLVSIHSLTIIHVAYVPRVEFPERPLALRTFLLGLHQGWNISLFHYRNHGAGQCAQPCGSSIMLNPSVDLGKVLAGIQVPPEDSQQFDTFLSELNYTNVEETQNMVYSRFLRG